MEKKKDNEGGAAAVKEMIMHANKGMVGAGGRLTHDGGQTIDFDPTQKLLEEDAMMASFIQAVNERFIAIELRFDKIEAELDRRMKESDSIALERDNHVMENLSQVAQAVEELNKKVENRI